MADSPSLEFIQRQQLDILNEMRALREDFAKSFRLLTDTQVSIGRTLSALDRRLSETKDDLETTLRMELVGHRNVTGDEIAKRIEELTAFFDKRYAPKEPVKPR